MRISASVDQLGVDADTLASALHAAFEKMRNAKLFPDLAQIARGSGLVLHYRSAADHFQIRNSCEAVENLVLDAHRKIGIRLIVAQVVEWKHRDTFLEWSRGDF